MRIHTVAAPGYARRWQASPVKPVGQSQLPYKCGVGVLIPVKSIGTGARIVTIANANVSAFHFAVSITVSTGLVNPCRRIRTDTCA